MARTRVVKTRRGVNLLGASEGHRHKYGYGWITNLCKSTVKNIYVSSSDIRKGLEFALIWSLDIGIIIIRRQPIP